jgi:acyl carrier protein
MERAFDSAEISLPIEEESGGGVGEPPVGDLECAIAEVWREVFKLEKVGRNDNFFELGGDSVTGMELADAFSARLDLQLPVVAIFQNPSVRELAQLITASM